MLLKDCELNPTHVVINPITRRRPEADWISCRDRGIIPKPLFVLYCRANFLSFGSAPTFLSDKDNLLFSYFSIILRGVKSSLSDADHELENFLDAHSQIPDYGKKARGEPTDMEAPDRARRHLKMFLFSLHSALDGTADLIAVILTGLLPNLQLGKSSFKAVEKWIRKPLPESQDQIVTPERYYVEMLYSRLQPLVISKGPERDWLSFMRTIRNKSAHFGEVFRYINLHDKEGIFYTFLPRRWPYFWETYYRKSGGKPEDYPPLSEILHDDLVHQDIRSYCQGLRKKVINVVETVADVLVQAYTGLSGLPTKEDAIAQLQNSMQRSRFERFLE